MTQLDNALQFLKRGWSVIPLKQQSKEPSINWERYQTEKATEEIVRQWFSASSNSNIGIVTGKISNLVVVDIDDPMIAKVEEPTFTVKTAKGFHHYFQHPNHGSTVNNRTKMFPGVDLRADGGYVVAPYSIHETGAIYKPLNPMAPILPLPSLFLEQQNKPIVVKQDGWLTEMLDGLTEGNRNDTFCRIVGKFHSQRYSPMDIFSLLVPHASKCGFDDKELFNQIQYICKRYSQPKDESQLVFHSPKGDWDEYREARTKSKGTIDLETGFSQLDIICGGWKRKELSIVGARTSIGKSTFLINSSLSLAKKGKSVLYFSTEMDYSDIFDRLACIEDKRSLHQIKSSFISKETEKRVKELNIRINDTSQPTAILIKKAVEEVKPDVVILDHLQHFGSSTDYRYGELSKFVRELKNIAREYNIAVIASSQLNREADRVDYRTGQREIPSLKHFKECGTIEDECGLGLLLYYSGGMTDADTPTLTVKVDKNRHGPCGSIGLRFNKPTFTLSSL